MKAITTSDKPQINQRIHQLIKMMHERNNNKDRNRENVQMTLSCQSKEERERR